MAEEEKVLDFHETIDKIGAELISARKEFNTAKLYRFMEMINQCEKPDLRHSVAHWYNWDLNIKAAEFQNGSWRECMISRTVGKEDNLGDIMLPYLGAYFDKYEDFLRSEFPILWDPHYLAKIQAAKAEDERRANLAHISRIAKSSNLSEEEMLEVFRVARTVDIIEK